MSAEEGLLANDTDPEDDPIQVAFVTDPSHGSCIFQEATPYGDGSFVYLPDAGFVGTDSFTYQISDGESLSDWATVTITVTNVAPTGQADQYTIDEDQVLITSGTVSPPSVPPTLPPPGGGGSGGIVGGPTLLENDADGDNDILRTLLVTDVSNGSLVLHDDGTFIYTPAPNFIGIDSFTYSLTDGVVNSDPVSVGITVESAGPFDLDGRDGATLTSWMSEPDEDEYGLAVSAAADADILARVHDLPPDWVVEQRRIYFDPEVLSVDGVTQPGYIELAPGGGNEVRTVSALVLGYGSTEIGYEVIGHIDGGGGPAQPLNVLVPMQVVEEKAVLRQLEFTSDHNVLRENTKDATKSGERYKNVEFVRATKYNAPMTQTVSRPTAESKMKVNVKWEWAGIPANTPFKLIAASNEDGLKIESPVLLTNSDGNMGIELTATNTVGTQVRTIDQQILWVMQLNPGQANQKSLPMGASGSHKIYLLFDAPRDQQKEYLQATDIRMDRTVAVAAKAVENSYAHIPPGTALTWQRIAFEIVQQHVFSSKKAVILLPWKEDNLKQGWAVYDTWTLPEAQRGADCLSGAVFSYFVAISSGMPGAVAPVPLAPKSETEVTKATPYDPNDTARRRVNAPDAQGIDKRLMLLDGGGVWNHYEGTLVYTPVQGGSTFYFPVVGGTPADVNDRPRFTNADHVLTLFVRAAWVNAATKQQLLPLDPAYQRAPNANID